MPLQIPIPLLIGLGLVALLWALARRGGRQTVPARDLRIIDGDTVWLADASGRIREKMRLATINAPETRGVKSLWQGGRGAEAKDELTRLLHQAHEIEVQRLGTDRYGRTLVKLYDRSRSRREIGLQLADAGYARYWE